MSGSLVNLKIKNPLASNPKNPPKYAVEVKTKKGDTIKVADPEATRAMVALMDMQAVMGGAASHFGGPAAFAEIMSALHGIAFTRSEAQNKNWYDLFHLVNDAGHCENGIYALKANYGFADLSVESLKGFRSIKSPLTGHGESHIWPEGVYISNGPLGSSLPQAQGLAFADALSGDNGRVTVTAISDGACMEGEAKESFAAIPGLAQKGKMAPFVLVISDNNTKLSGRIDDQSFSMNPSFSSLEDLGWKVFRLEDGHNLQKVMETLEEAIDWTIANPTQPAAVHVKTVKGKGVKKTEESASGGHGFPLKAPNELHDFVSEIYSGKEVPSEFVAWIKEMEEQAAAKTSSGSKPSVPEEKVQVGVANAMINTRKAGRPVVSISSDLAGSTGVAAFQKEFPDSFVDVGIAESNMVSMAAGLSKQGFIPVVDTFAQFGVTKGALPLTMASLSSAPIIAIYSHAGFQDAADGASHQALSYISMLASIPHVDLYQLSTSSEAEALVGQAIEEFAQEREAGRVPNSKIFFLGRENFPRYFEGKEINYKLGQSFVAVDNSDKFENSVTFAASGPTLHQAISASEKLAEQGVGSIVISPSRVNRPDLSEFKAALKKSNGRLVTADDHQKIGGMGALLTHALTESGETLKLKSLGVNDGFGQSAYEASELYAKHGLDAAAMVTAAQSLL